MRNSTIAIAVLAAFAAGWLLRNATAPATLIHTGLEAVLGDRDGLQAQIHAYEVTDKALRAQIQASKAREQRAVRLLEDARNARYKALAKVRDLEARAPEIERHVAEAEQVLRVPPPPDCRPLYDEVVKLAADVEWASDMLDAKSDEIRALDSQIYARDLEFTELRLQNSQYRGRLEAAQVVIRKAKKSGRRSKIAGFAILGAGIFIATR